MVSSWSKCNVRQAEAAVVQEMVRCVLNPLRWYECRIAYECVNNAAPGSQKRWNVVGGDPKFKQDAVGAMLEYVS